MVGTRICLPDRLAILYFIGIDFWKFKPGLALDWIKFPPIYGSDWMTNFNPVPTSDGPQLYCGKLGYFIASNKRSFVLGFVDWLKMRPRQTSAH